jgi:hypothetical protein
MGRRRESRLDKHVGEVGNMGYSVISLKVLFYSVGNSEALMVEHGSQMDQSLSSKSKERQSNHQVDCSSMGKMFETARTFFVCLKRKAPCTPEFN